MSHVVHKKFSVTPRGGERGRCCCLLPECFKMVLIDVTSPASRKKQGEDFNNEQWYPPGGERGGEVEISLIPARREKLYVFRDKEGRHVSAQLVDPVTMQCFSPESCSTLFFFVCKRGAR